MNFIGLFQFFVNRKLLDHHFHFRIDKSGEIEIDSLLTQVFEYLFQGLDSVDVDMIDLSEIEDDSGRLV